MIVRVFRGLGGGYVLSPELKHISQCSYADTVRICTMQGDKLFAGLGVKGAHGQGRTKPHASDVRIRLKLFRKLSDIRGVKAKQVNVIRVAVGRIYADDRYVHIAPVEKDQWSGVLAEGWPTYCEAEYLRQLLKDSGLKGNKYCRLYLKAYKVPVRRKISATS